LEGRVNVVLITFRAVPCRFAMSTRVGGHRRGEPRFASSDPAFPPHWYAFSDVIQYAC
jgi:hypothetical protein